MEAVGWSGDGTSHRGWWRRGGGTITEADLQHEEEERERSRPLRCMLGGRDLPRCFLTGEDELLLHDVGVPAGCPDRGAQHDLLRVVAAHAAQPIPAGSEVGQKSQHRSVSPFEGR